MEKQWNEIEEQKKQWSLDYCVLMLENSYKAQINKIANLYMYESTVSNGFVYNELFYKKIEPLLIRINNEINDCISDKFKGNFNIKSYDMKIDLKNKNNDSFKMIKECEWCSYDIICDILCYSIKHFDITKGRDFGKYFFNAIRDLCGNITNKMKHNINKNGKHEVSLDMDNNNNEKTIDMILNLTWNDMEVNYVEYNILLDQFSKILNEDESKLFLILRLDVMIDEKNRFSASKIRELGKYTKREYDNLLKSIKQKFINFYKMG